MRDLIVFFYMLRKLIIAVLLIIVVLVSITGIIFFPYLQFKNADASKTEGKRPIYIVGHRGAAGLAPENTLSAFDKALAVGVDIIELDVHLSKDGQVVVIHDSNLKRTTGHDAEIEHLTLEEIRSFDAGSWFDKKYQGERIPSLNQVLKKVAGQCIVLIEIKWPNAGIYDGIVKEVFKSIDKYDAQDWTIIQSFETRYLHQVNALRPGIETHQLLFGASKWLPVYHDRDLHWKRFKPLPFVKSVNLYYKFLPVSKKWSTFASDAGVYTVNDIQDMIKARALGAKYLITDRPDLAADLFK